MNLRSSFITLFSITFWLVSGSVSFSTGFDGCLRAALDPIHPSALPIQLGDLDQTYQNLTKARGTAYHSTLLLQAETQFKNKFNTIVKSLQESGVTAAEKARHWETYGAELHRIKPLWAMTPVPVEGGGHLYSGAAGYALFIDEKGVVSLGKIDTALLVQLQNKPARITDPLVLGLKPVPTAKTVEPFKPIIENVPQLEEGSLKVEHFQSGPKRETVDLKITAGPATSQKRVGVLSGYFEGDKTHFNLSSVQVVPEARHQGLQDLLVQSFVRHHPEVTKIGVSLAETNIEAAADYLVAAAQKHPRFSELNRGQAWIPTLRQKGLMEARKGAVAPYYRLSECCSQFMVQLEEKYPSEFDELVHEAIRSTPTYRSQAKAGFGKICDVDYSTEPGIAHEKFYLFYLSYEVCK